ncbi:P-loop containing nucleoside triphosphate hydrolase protein [Irpex lacteus]|nr:P-loop containing nucleoside triphosphate hydrolase protein [Irpex lacteus]
MVIFTVDRIRELMGKPTNIRNMSVIGHADHGKSTLVDSIALKACMLTGRRQTRPWFGDTTDDTITIKSTAISMYFELEEEYVKTIKQPTEGREFLINLIGTLGPIDYLPEITPTLRVTDGALVVVDCVEGFCGQTETLLRQALLERVTPVLVINKLDRAILDFHTDNETLFQEFRVSSTP